LLGFLVGLAGLPGLALQPAAAFASASANWGIEAGLPAGAGTNPFVQLTSVSCAATGYCGAVGKYVDSSDHAQGVLLTQTAGTWAAGVNPTLPAGAGTEGAEVTSVSCALAGNCSAVGSYADDSGNEQGLLLTQSGGTWATGVKATLPAGAATNPSVQLFSVSCASAGNCSAVGNYVDSSGHSQGVLLTQSAGTWASGVEVTLPAGAGTEPLVAVLSVSCSSAGNCSAVGRYVDGSNSFQGLLLTESDGTWAAGVKATPPAGAGANPNDRLLSVSCSSAGNCSAVGDYFDGNGRQGMLLTQSAGTWATGVQATPPANAGTNPFVTLSSVSCASAGNCGAVGTYLDGSSHFRGLLLTQSSGTLGAGIEAALPAGAGTNPGVSLNSVSCASVGNCSAVGHYAENSGNQRGVLLTESSGTWAQGIEAGLPAGAGTDPHVSLNSVSCAFAGNCSAVGDYSDSSDRQQGLLLSTPAVSTTASSANLGQAIHDDATLIGGDSPTGTITFKAYYEDPGCSTPAAYNSGPIALSGGQASSGDFTPDTRGRYYWTADYSGAVGNAAASSPCGAGGETSIVKATPTLSTSASSANLGEAINDTATLSADEDPTGDSTVTFKAYDTSDCSDAPVYTSDPAVVHRTFGPNEATSGDFTPSRAGRYHWTADYSGDTFNAPASSPCGAADETSGVANRVTVKNRLVPASDPGRFDLIVNTLIVKVAAGNGGTNSTGVADGSLATVSEAGAGATRLADYRTTYRCDGNFGRIEGMGTRVRVRPSGSPATCTFTNTRRPARAGVQSGKATLDAGGAVSIPLSCRAHGLSRCRGTLTLTARCGHGFPCTQRDIGTSSFSIPDGERQAVQIVLSGHARDYLETHRSVFALARARTRQADGTKRITSSRGVRIHPGPSAAG
jgi:hypothetical protein